MTGTPRNEAPFSKTHPSLPLTIVRGPGGAPPNATNQVGGFVFTNAGNAPETFSLTVSGGAGNNWVLNNWTLYNSHVVFQPGSGSSAYIYITVPLTARAGTYAVNLTVKATATLNGLTKTATSSTAITFVVPPKPKA